MSTTVSPTTTVTEYEKENIKQLSENVLPYFTLAPKKYALYTVPSGTVLIQSYMLSRSNYLQLSHIYEDIWYDLE